MLRKLRTSVALLAAATLVAASALPAAADIESDDIVAATPVGVDAFIMRPLGMLTSVIGISMFAVSAPVVLLQWAWRERGLLVADGNPRSISGIDDLAGLTIVPRQPEAGSQVLLDSLLARAGLAGSRGEGMPRFATPPARSEADMALAVAEGKADAGLGLASLAQQYRLGFVPLLRERFDLAVLRRAYFEPPFQRFMAFCGSLAFQVKADELGGYDLKEFGRVHWNGP